MLDGSQKSIQSLSRQSSSRHIRNGDGKHQRNFSSCLLHGKLCRTDSRLCIQCIKNSFNQNGIYPSFQQGLHLFYICRFKYIEGQGTKSRIIDIRTHRTGLIGRPYGTRYKTRLLRGASCIFIRNLPRQTCCRQIDFPTIRLHMIISH